MRLDLPLRTRTVPIVDHILIGLIFTIADITLTFLFFQMVSITTLGFTSVVRNALLDLILIKMSKVV